MTTEPPNQPVAQSDKAKSMPVEPTLAHLEKNRNSFKDLGDTLAF
ncbi:hypothetical protein [Candidatus Williamhamiltonella defendens]|nr:hypothetical protein [Candidatus Hamiltonella defensa]